MGKIDKIKEISTNKREAFRGLFLILVAVLSGTVTVLYAVVNGSVRLPMLMFSAAGLMLAVFLAILLARLWHELEDLAEEAKND